MKMILGVIGYKSTGFRISLLWKEKEQPGISRLLPQIIQLTRLYHMVSQRIVTSPLWLRDAFRHDKESRVHTARSIDTRYYTRASCHSYPLWTWTSYTIRISSRSMMHGNHRQLSNFRPRFLKSKKKVMCSFNLSSFLHGVHLNVSVLEMSELCRASSLIGTVIDFTLVPLLSFHTHKDQSNDLKVWKRCHISRDEYLDSFQLINVRWISYTYPRDIEPMIR